MFAQIIFAVMPALAWGFTSPHREAALLGAAHHSHAPDQEEMSDNMHFEPLSTTMKCVIGLTLQYIIVYTALGISRSYCDFNGVPHDKSAVAKALKSASETVFFAPMACLLFLGFRMRVLQLTKGEGNPQGWARMCMEAVAYSILANTIIALVVPIFTEHEVEVDEHGELKPDSPNPFSNNILATLFTVLRYVTFLALYVGFGGVCLGVYMFEPPKGVWEGPIPDVSPAVACTMTLSFSFFESVLFDSTSVISLVTSSTTRFACCICRGVSFGLSTILWSAPSMASIAFIPAVPLNISSEMQPSTRHTAMIARAVMATCSVRRMEESTNGVR